MNNDNKKIEPVEKSKYKIGAVTYEVTAVFNEHEANLKDKLQRVLVDEIQKNPINMFASQ